MKWGLSFRKNQSNQTNGDFRLKKTSQTKSNFFSTYILNGDLRIKPVKPNRNSDLLLYLYTKWGLTYKTSQTK